MTGMQNIIILGGGYAGVGVARALEKRIANNNNYRIILIEKVQLPMQFYNDS